MEVADARLFAELDDVVGATNVRAPRLVLMVAGVKAEYGSSVQRTRAIANDPGPVLIREAAIRIG